MNTPGLVEIRAELLRDGKGVYGVGTVPDPDPFTTFFSRTLAFFPVAHPETISRRAKIRRVKDPDPMGMELFDGAGGARRFSILTGI